MAIYVTPWHHYLLNHHSFICHVSAKPACLLNRGNLVIIAHAHEQSAVSDQVARVVPPASSRD